MSSIEKFKKHINKSVKVVLKNKDGEEDEFEFKPLNVEQFTTLMVLGDKINKTGDSSDLDPAYAKDLMNLYVDIIKFSYPDLDNETAGQFVVSNFQELSDIMEKLSPEKMDDKKLETLKRIKEMQINNQVQPAQA